MDIFCSRKDLKLMRHQVRMEKESMKSRKSWIPQEDNPIPKVRINKGSEVKNTRINRKGIAWKNITGC